MQEIYIDETKGLSPDEVVVEKESVLARNDHDLHDISETLKEIIADKKLPPEMKARVIHEHSVDMMKCLWKNPTGEKLAEFKKSVVCVVENILTDDATNKHLLKLTDYDYNTYVHSVNVGVLALSLAKELFKKQNRHDMHALGAGFFLHDLGKVAIDEGIINKPGKLTDEEMAIMRRHPGMGFKLLHETKQITEESRLIVLQHHERYNGSGYPRGLRGSEIHIYGRICSVADVFDALVSKRPYKAQKKPFEALKIMKEEMIDHFQKEVFQTFVLLFI
jgi:HD-GYP domain-containing protein (c-di-GMP phosphodiesterase class II)